MPAFERKTTSRGRSAVPDTFPRTRRWRRARACRVESFILGPLPDLAADVLSLVANPLALVGLGRPHAPDLGRSLTDRLLVDPLDDDLRRRGHLEGDAGARRDHDRVREADGELEVGAPQRRAVADALNLEPLLEALRDAIDHVRDQRPREPVQRAVLAALGRPRDDDGAVRLLDADAPRHRLAELAERPVDLHTAGGERDGHARRHRDRLSSDAAHAPLSVTRRSR